jgi:hypothetical protein
MKWFDKQRIPEGSWPFLFVIRPVLREIKDGMESAIDLTEGLEDITITGCMRAYKQALDVRVLELSASIISLWNVGHPLGAVVCSRALLETLAIFYSFFRETKSLADKKEWQELQDTVDAYAFFSTSQENTSAPLTTQHPKITKITESFIKENFPEAVGFWNQICDHVHPNGMNVMEFAGVLQNSQFLAKDTLKNDKSFFSAVYNCLYAVTWYYAESDSFLKMLDTIKYED